VQLAGGIITQEFPETVYPPSNWGGCLRRYSGEFHSANSHTLRRRSARDSFAWQTALACEGGAGTREPRPW